MIINKNNHAFLIKEIKFSNTEEIINNICKSFFDEIEEKELYCRKIDNRNYYDFFEFNLYLKDIKVDEINELKSCLLSTPLENANYKFYIIKNIDLLSNKIANSLLKFIEEPPKNTIAIFTTKNVNKVLETICSRCELINSKSDFEKAKKYLENEANQEIKNFYLKSFFSLEEIKQFQKSKNKDKIIDMYLNIQNNKDNKKIIFDYLENFKKFSLREISIFLNSLINKNNVKNKEEIIKILPKIKLNLSKSLIFNLILNSI